MKPLCTHSRKVALSLLISVFSCGGFDGPSVLEKKDFLSDIKTAERLTIYRCALINGENLGESSANDPLIALLAASASATNTVGDVLSLGADRRYFTTKDRDTCIQSILAVPCGSQWIAELTIAEHQYCSPDRASLWQNQHPGQGEWSTPAGGPSF